ncbi:MAG: ABC transporter permease [Conexibacter sp.]
MTRFLLRRLAMLVVTLLVASFAIFAALELVPGSPIATLSGGRTLPPESIAVLNERFNLDEPFLARYWDWLTGALHGDLGISIAKRQDVSSLIGERIGTTAMLVLMAALIIVIVGIALGVIGALRPGFIDTGVLVSTTIGVAVPSFVAAIVLIAIFAVNLGWFPAFGSGSGFGDRIWHLTLPSIALAASSVAVLARVTRASVQAELKREHVQTAVSRGIPWQLVLRRHVLRNAAIPITTVAGITIASLIALSAVVERAFSLDGLGSYLINAALSKDYAVVQGISLVLIVSFVAVNTLVDVLYAVLDPRVKLGSRAA